MFIFDIRLHMQHVSHGRGRGAGGGWRSGSRLASAAIRLREIRNKNVIRELNEAERFRPRRRCLPRVDLCRAELNLLTP